MKKKSKMSWKEVLKINRRAFGIWWKVSPKRFVLDAISRLLAVVISYINIWFSARILEELVAKRAETLIRIVLILLVLNIVLGICRTALQNYVSGTDWVGFQKIKGLYNNKMLSMDFSALDNSHTKELLAQIEQNENWSGWGMQKLYHQFGRFLESIFGIGGAVMLCWQLFVKPVSEDSVLVIMNHPLFGAAIIILLFVAVILAPAIENRSDSYWSNYADSARFGNRAFGFFGYMGFDLPRGADVRMYRQDVFCRNGMYKHDSFGIRSGIAKLAKGPMGKLSALADVVGSIFTGCVYLFVCLKAYAGAFGIGEITRYISAVKLFYDNLSTFLQTAGELRTNAPFLKLVLEFFDIPEPMYKGSLTVEKREDCNYEIEFRNVSFRYPGTEIDVLKNVSMKFKVGEKLAVVGENGSGKTTFIKLLCRLYDPTEGEILLNGIDIRKYNYGEYMSIFSVVFQDFKLLAFPLGQNTAAGVEYDREKAMHCLKEAGLGERMENMPDGLDSYLYKDFDENGVEISGGEAQKIAIARALYKNAAFLVLDEPTAALDPIAEYEIYAKFNEIAGERTAIYISHRLSSCRFCNRIMVFDNGRICQQGNHESLVSDEHGKYHALWNAQAQYYV